jgi:flagellar hook protein FlgE
MLSSILSAFSGMLGFSKALDVISNNVGNMNTPGFKASELRFRDMFYRYGLSQGGGGSEQIGQGVDTGETRTKFRQGELRQTDNGLDSAINGNGFFVLQKDGQTFYTRNGQFEFNDDGVLIEKGSGATVASLSGGGLHEISISGLRVSAPRATSEVTFVDNLSTGSTTHTINNIVVLDAAGASHTLTAVFTNNSATTAGSWLVEVREGTTVLHNGEIRYQGTGAPAAAPFNALTFTYAPPGGVPSSVITFNFGAPGTFSGSTSLSGGTTSGLRFATQDGFGLGSMLESTFSENGTLTLKYTNGQTVTHDRVALAWFEDLQALTLSGGNLFTSRDGQTPIFSMPDQNGMGTILSKRVELSNVELTEQFTEMVVIQRGYQASSQVISVANEMTQQLLDLRGRR